MALIDLDDEFLELFYNITNTKIPAEPTLIDLKKQLINVVDTLKELNKNAKKPIFSKALGNEEEANEASGPAILVVDDLKPGYDMARGGGAHFAAAGWAYDVPKIADFMRKNCDYYLSSVDELRALLEEK